MRWIVVVLLILLVVGGVWAFSNHQALVSAQAMASRAVATVQAVTNQPVPTARIVTQVVTVTQPVQTGVVLQTQVVMITATPVPATQTPTPNIVVSANPTMPSVVGTLPVVLVPQPDFGKGTCVINGKTFDLSRDSTAVWMDGALNEAIWVYGGRCEVVTVEPGWYWSVAGVIKRNGVLMANGNRLNAEPGSWVFDYPAPAAGMRAENYGFTFRDNVPGMGMNVTPVVSPAAASNVVSPTVAVTRTAVIPTITPVAIMSTVVFGKGSCSIDKVVYMIPADEGNMWLDPFAAALREKGGTCTVETYLSGYLWSGSGQITFNGVVFKNGSGMEAKPGKWTFVYNPNDQNNGFVFHATK